MYRKSEGKEDQRGYVHSCAAVPVKILPDLIVFGGFPLSGAVLAEEGFFCTGECLLCIKEGKREKLRH